MSPVFSLVRVSHKTGRLSVFTDSWVSTDRALAERLRNPFAVHDRSSRDGPSSLNSAFYLLIEPTVFFRLKHSVVLDLFTL